MINNNEIEWGNDSVYTSTEELGNLVEQLWDYKNQISNLNQEIDKLKENKNGIEKKLLTIMRDSGFERIDSRSCSASVMQKTSVRIPHTKEQKEIFFDWLKEKEIFWEKVNINSQSLNSLYKTELEIAKENGISNFNLPGITEVSDYYELSLRKRK